MCYNTRITKSTTINFEELIKMHVLMKNVKIDTVPVNTGYVASANERSDKKEAEKVGHSYVTQP